MARLIKRLTCAFGLLFLVGLSGAATAATPAHDQPVTPPGAAATPAVERMAGCRSRSYQCYGLRKGCRVVRDPYLRDYYIRCPQPRWSAPAPRYWW
jgi:hypothetical protein